MQDTIIKEKCIYLDIDGVLNSDKTLARTPNRYIGISSDKVKLLKEIVKATDACIILSSSWRLMEEYDEDKKYLYKQLRYKDLKIVDQTKKLSMNRGLEISKHLEEHPEIKSFVILDDEFAQCFADAGLKEHYIQTDYTTGLTKADVMKAIKILNDEFDNVNYKDNFNEKHFGREL